MLRKTLLLTMVVLFALAANAALAWRISYFGDVDPTTAGCCGYSEGNLFRWSIRDGDAALGSVVDDAQAIDGKAYRILDNSTTANLQWRTIPTLNIGSDTGVTVVARMKVLSDSNGGWNLGFLNDAGVSAAAHYGSTGDGHVRVKETYRNIEQVLSALADGAYHIVRVAAQGTGAKKTVPYTEGFAYADGFLSGQGGWTGTATGEVQVMGGEAYVYGAGGEVQADQGVWVAPGPDGKITLTAKLRRDIYSIEDGWVSTLKVYNRAGVQIAGWQANSYQVKGRLGGDNTVLHDISETGWTSLQLVIDANANTATYTADGVVLNNVVSGAPYLPCIGNDVGQISVSRFNDARAVGFSVVWDDLALTGSPLSGRTVNVFVDENPTPALSILNASNIGRSPESFLMGAAGDDGTAQQDVYIDWITGSADGAYAPGQDTAALGTSLVIGGAATTIDQCKTLPVGSQVLLNEAIVTETILGPVGTSTNITGFAIESADRSSGIRVVWPGDPGTALDIGYTVNIDGILADVNGERVIVAGMVKDIGYAESAITPLGMNNAASGGGAFGLQPAVARNARMASGAPAFQESFAYANGPIVGNDSWSGTAGSELSVDSGTLKISGGYNGVAASRGILAGDCGTNEISVKFKIKKGAGADNYWYLYLTDAGGKDLAYFMGSGTQISGKTGAGSTAAQLLTGGWDNVEVKIYPSSDQSEFFFNGTSIGVLSHAAPGVGDYLGSMRFDRIDRSEVDTHLSYVNIDDVVVGPSAVMSTGLNSIGLYQTIFGKVTWVQQDLGNSWNSFFLVDDGSGIVDPSGNVGVRCRPASSPSQMGAMPSLGATISVTGAMGVQKVGGVDGRYLWTWSFTAPY